MRFVYNGSPEDLISALDRQARALNKDILYGCSRLKRGWCLFPFWRLYRFVYFAPKGRRQRDQDFIEFMSARVGCRFICRVKICLKTESSWGALYFFI